MTNVWIDRDEWWPVYSFKEHELGDSKVSKMFLKKANRVFKEFNEVQGVLHNKYKKSHPDKKLIAIKK